MKTLAKGMVQFVNQRTTKAGKIGYEIIIDGINYWDSKGSFKDSVNKQVDYEWELGSNGSIRFITLPGEKPNFPNMKKKDASRDESFALSYAKDIAVALIEKGLLTQTAQIDQIVNHYFGLFMEKLTPKS